MAKDKKEIIAELLRPQRKKRTALIDPGDDWNEHWWGMPEYTTEDVSPQHRISMNFLTTADMEEFKRLAGITLTNKNSGWFPSQPRIEPGVYAYYGEPAPSRYPVCIPTKGRAATASTGKHLDKMGVAYKFFVEETEEDAYKEIHGEDKVVVLPFHDLGKGSIPARNFIWDYTREREHARHWIMDDNMENFGRTNFNRRLNVFGGKFFQAMEDFVDRYENIAIAGPHDRKFVPDRTRLSPYLMNHRVYSCILLDNKINFKWRGKYNEDTDLSLRILKEGYCSVLFRALYMAKAPTHKGDGKSGQSGGNSDTIYEKNDYRLKFAKSLQKQHPDVCEIIWRYGRWHHQVDYSPFKKNKLILKDGVVPLGVDDDYGMTLEKRPKKKNPKLRKRTKKDD